MSIFSIFRRNTTTDLSWLGTDMHSHLVPGIDDGAPDPSTSVQLVKGLAELGFSRLITTPHILWEVYPNTEEAIRAEIEPLRQEIRKAGLETEIHGAAEYFIDEYFARQLRKKIPLLTLARNLVLVEFSLVNQPMDLQEIIFEMQMQEYQPVIAHPERYIYLSRKKTLFDELKNAGCYFQLNLLSLTGYYGGGVQQLAEYLIKQEYYDFAGTDLHNDRHLQALGKLSGSSSLSRLRDSGKLKNSKL